MKNLNYKQFILSVVLFIVFLLNPAYADSESVLNLAVRAPQSISTFIQASLNHQPELLAAEANIDLAKANLRASRQPIYNPNLEFNYEKSGLTTRSVGISQTIDWANQQDHRESVANAKLNQEISHYQVIKQTFISGLLISLAKNQTEKQLLKLSSESLHLMLEFKQIAERRYLAGDLTKVELNLATLAYNQALMEQAAAYSNSMSAYEALQSIADVRPSEIPVLPEQLPQPNLPQDLDLFLNTLPVIKAELAEIEAARQQVLLSKSEQSWDPTIGVTIGTEGSDDLIGLNLNIPLNIRNNFSAEVDIAYQNMVSREYLSQKTYRNLRTSLKVSTERYRSLLTVWNNWRENNRGHVAEQLALVNQLWQAGDINATDYLLQIKQALEIKITGYRLRNQLWQVAFDWMKVTASVDQWLDINVAYKEKG
ncbi:MAG: hypothetical protein COB23_07925 [Methylophaga sp.]|nr:MAG: hypothetical protein COB23_07925 [Methylophaga sp.]